MESRRSGNAWYLRQIESSWEGNVVLSRWFVRESGRVDIPGGGEHAATVKEWGKWWSEPLRGRVRSRSVATAWGGC